MDYGGDGPNRFSTYSLLETQNSDCAYTLLVRLPTVAVFVPLVGAGSLHKALFLEEEA